MKVLWLAKRTYGKDYYSEYHFHKYYHFIYHISGQGKLSIGDESFDLQEDTLYLTPKNNLHSYTSTDNNGIQTLEVKFIELSTGLSNEIDQLPFEVIDTNLYLKAKLDNAVSEGMSKKPHYQEMINLKLSEMIYQLIRNQGKDHVSAPSKRWYEETENKNLHEAVIYMEENFSFPLDLDTLAEISCYNSSYFCRLFRSEFGESPIHYLIKLRINKAKELLREHAMTISETAYAVGFESIHYFSRCFTRWVECSPKEYRERYRNNIFLKLEDKGYALNGIVPEV